jgi:hypothetical protein
MSANLQFDRTTAFNRIVRTLLRNFLEEKLDLVLGPNGKDTANEHIFLDRQLISLVEFFSVRCFGSIQWESSANPVMISKKNQNMRQTRVSQMNVINHHQFRHRRDVGL